jgi:hypothetical protein
MQRYEAAVIHMQQNFNDISFLFSEFNRLENVRTTHPELIFSDISIAFLSAISSELVKSPTVRQYSDVATFAFFCRKANLMSLKKKYTDVVIRLGRGVVFHIAPSNVPVNFAYSMVAGILSGNINIVRVPSKFFEQVDIICEAINRVALNPDFSDIANRLFLVRYDRQNEATAKLSLLCDVRVIWGGDDTIAQIRKSILPARSYDVTFADRYSFAAINADKFIYEKNVNKIAENFYNDTYLFDQNACSAPRLVIWTGTNENIEKAKEIFWSAIELKIQQYELSPLLSVDKLSTLYIQSQDKAVIKREISTNNKLWRVNISELTNDIDKYRCAGGYFLEYNAVSLKELVKIVNQKYQTMAYYGYEKEELSELVNEMRFNGIDRIVPIGKTTDFGLIWDGYDLINVLSRECVIL